MNPVKALLAIHMHEFVFTRILIRSLAFQVEVFGDFRRRIRIQRVELYHIDPWKHRKYTNNS